MLILINIDILVKVLDLIHVPNFHCRLLNGVKMLLFLVRRKIDQGILLIEKKYILVLGVRATDKYDDITIMVQAKYCYYFKLRKKIYLNFTL